MMQPFESITCSGHGTCECNEDDPIDDAKCVCEDGFNGRYCDTTDAELAQELEKIAALELEADSLRFAGIIDAPDDDDDNDGIPDDKEVEVVDHDEDTESIPEIVEGSGFSITDTEEGTLRIELSIEFKLGFLMETYRAHVW